MGEFLVSVQNDCEFTQTLRAGVAWIDLKNPGAGSLGAPTLETALAVSKLIQGQRSSRIFRTSIALGELIDIDVEDVQVLLSNWHNLGMDFAKVGLSSCASRLNTLQSLQSLNERLGSDVDQASRLIPVCYADSEIADAPCFDDVLEFAVEMRSHFVLVDTFRKDGKSLLDWCSKMELHRMIQAAHSKEIGISFAGGLRMENIEGLRDLGPDVIAVRGAVCRKGARVDTLDEDRLSEFVALQRTPEGIKPIGGLANLSVSPSQAKDW